MSGRAAISVFILDITAVLLLLFGLLVSISGLCLAKPEVVKKATLGLIDSYTVCAKLHLGWVSLATIIIAVVHSTAGLDIWLLKSGRDYWWLWALGGGVTIWFIYIYTA